MAVVRQVFSDGRQRDRATAIADLPDALGYRRLGSRIRATLDDDIRTAVRRGILENTPSGLRLLVQNIGEYTRDHLRGQLLAGMGYGWWHQEDLIVGTARWLGFRRTGRAIEKALKSAVHSGIRQGLLERQGRWLRRIR